MLFIDGFIFFAIIVIIETRWFYWLLEIIKNNIPGYYKSPSNEAEELDEDVLDEQQRIIQNYDVYNDVLKVKNLQKKFRKLTAVKNVSFGVKTGECFGLLGINGAGKTTTFRMLTGDETASDGDAEVFSSTLTSNRRKFLSQIGYCPQFDSIIPELTGDQ